MARDTEVEMRNAVSFLLASLLILRGGKKPPVVASVKFLELKIKYDKETWTGVPGGEGFASQELPAHGCCRSQAGQRRKIVSAREEV